MNPLFARSIRPLLAKVFIISRNLKQNLFF